MKFLAFLASLTVLLTACSGPVTRSPVPALENVNLDESHWILPESAVILAARAAPDVIQGTFAMTVRATGTRNQLAFLNSEAEYQDQRNLTVVLEAGALVDLNRRMGGDALAKLKGHDILVHGEAARTRIDLSCRGRPTGKYYYQTQIRVTQADQIEVR